MEEKTYTNWSIVWWYFIIAIAITEFAFRIFGDIAGCGAVGFVTFMYTRLINQEREQERRNKEKSKKPEGI